MKKAIITLASSILLLTSFTVASAQTVVANKQTIKLDLEKIHYLHRFNNQAIDQSLKYCVTFYAFTDKNGMIFIKSDTSVNKGINIKYNSTADLIIAIINKHKNG